MMMRTEMYEMARPERPSLISRTLSTLLDAVYSVERWVEFRQQRREMLALDDRMLKDIGLSRGDIMRVKPRRKPPLTGM